MMKTGFRAAALFAVYSTIGFWGDYTATLLGRDDVSPAEPSVVVEETEAPAPDVVVEVRPEVRVDIALRESSACTYEDVREMTVLADGLSRVSIQAGAGELRVEGREGLEDVVVAAVACASVEDWLTELNVQTAEGPDGIELVTRYPERRGSGGDETARLDLTVLVPAGFGVEIDDSSGDIDVRGVGDLRIDDSSGSILVDGVDGSVTTDDSSGDVVVRNVTGDLDLDDGSGNVELASIGGSASVRDGSGAVTVVEVGGDVLIAEDGSGSIDVRSIGGDFVVDDDGSGSIRYADVAGRVDVPRDGRRKRRRPGRPGR